MNAPTKHPWRYHAPLALLLAINLINYVDRFVLAAVVPRIRAELFAPDDPLRDFWMGLLATAFLVSYMVAAPLFGYLADRMSRWLIVGLGVMVWSLASGASGLASTYLMLLVTRLFVGIGEAAYGPAAPTIISDRYSTEHRGSALAWFYMAIPVGSALGFVLGGWMANTWDWRMAFYASVPPGIALGLFALTMKDRRGVSTAARHSLWQDYATLCRTPSYVWNTLGMTAMTFAVGGIAYWIPSYVHDYRGEPDLGRVNMIFGAVTVVAGLTATLLGGLCGDRLRARYGGSYFLVSAVGMTLALPLFLLVLVVPFPAAWGLIFLTVFCLFFNTGPTNTILANVTHPSVRASGFALNIFVIHLLGDCISPPLIGWLTDISGGNMNIGFSSVSVAILVSAVCWFRGMRHLAEDTAAVSSS